MKEYELGKEGEEKARQLLNKMGYYLHSPDWLGKKDGKWTKFEVKRKERFISPPFDGHGLDLRQIKSSKEFQDDTGIRTYLMIFEIETENIYGQYLDILEIGKYFDTQYGSIRIYPLERYDKLN